METLQCDSCSAPLDVPERANFVKCNHCGQQLAVRRSATVTFTEAVDRLSETAQTLSRQNELAALDRRWNAEREEYMITDKHGHRHLPTEGASLIGGIVIVLFGCFWTAMAIGITSGAPNFGPFALAKFAFPAFGVLFILGGIAMSIHNYQKAKDYRAAHRRYEAERRQITNDET